MFINIFHTNWMQAKSLTLTGKPILKFKLNTKHSNFDIFIYLYIEEANSKGKLLSHQTFHYKDHHNSKENTVYLDFNLSTKTIPKNSQVSLNIDIWSPNKLKPIIEMGLINLTINNQSKDWVITKHSESEVLPA